MAGKGKRGNGNGGGNGTVTCYQLRNNNIETFDGSPCGDASGSNPVACCHTGDTCLEDNFCYFSHTLDGASQFYSASCTDPQHKDSGACSNRCGRLPALDVVFDPRSNLWACCNATQGPGGGLQRHCGNPSDETFQAPAPQQLLAAASSTTSVSLTATVSPTGAPATPTTAAPASSGISAGTAAGIGVGAGVGGILVLSLIAFFAVRWWRRRKALERDGATVKPGAALPLDEPTPMYPGTGAGLGGVGEKDVKRHSAAPTDGAVSELGYAGTKKSHASGVSEPNRTSELPAGVAASPQPVMELDGAEVERRP